MKLLAIVLLLALTGCAAHRIPTELVCPPFSQIHSCYSQPIPKAERPSPVPHVNQ